MQNGLNKEQKESRNFSPKRKMFDLKHLKTFNECIVGDIFKYKNQVFMKVVFRSIIISNFHKKFRPVMLTNQSLLSGESDGSDENNLLSLPLGKLNAHNTVKVQSQRSSEKLLSNLHKPMMNLISTNADPRISNLKRNDNKLSSNHGEI